MADGRTPNNLVNSPLSLAGSRWLAVFLILVLLTFSGLILYGGYGERSAFTHAHTVLGRTAVTSGASQLAMLLDTQRRGLKGYSRLYQDRLLTLVDGVSHEQLSVENLAAHIREFMPALASLALVDLTQERTLAEVPVISPGQQLIRKQVRGDGELYPFLSPSSENGITYYHIPARVGSQRDAILMASFDADLMADILRRTRPAGHALLLVRHGDGEIQLSVAGDSGDGDLAGTESGGDVAELSSALVAGSDWRLVDVPEARLMTSNLYRIILHRALTIGLIVLFVGTIYFLLMRREKALRLAREGLLQANEQLRYESMHDALTGLPNRALLEEKIRSKIVDSKRTGSRFMLMLVSLNNFQHINKILGYEIGDRVLQHLAIRLSNLLREVDSVTRFEGDIFAIVADINEKSQASIIARKVTESLDEPVDLADSPLNITASIGVVICPEQGRDLDTLIRHADSAVNSAKAHGGQTVVFSAAAEKNGLDRLSLITGLKQAMDRGQLSMVYQPKLSLTAPEQQSFEALLRWEHTEYGSLPCDMFIPLIEQTKYILDLTYWTIEHCFEVLGRLRENGNSPTMAINLSAQVLDEESFPQWLEQALERYDLQPGSIRFELTESAMMNDSERAIQLLFRLAAIGVGLSVDDFGVGHSSLAYISRLPVDELKVDKSFILNMHKKQSDHAIVKATIDLAHDLGLSVVAEGVETEEQSALLRAMECDYLQGFFISHPLPEEQLVNWLEYKNR